MLERKQKKVLNSLAHIYLIRMLVILEMLIMSACGAEPLDYNPDTEYSDVKSNTDSDRERGWGTDTVADEDIDTNEVTDEVTDEVIDEVIEKDDEEDIDSGKGNCESPFVAAWGRNHGDVTRKWQHYETTCDPFGGDYGSGADEFWKFVPEKDGTLTVSMIPRGWDFCAIEVMTRCGKSRTSLACDSEPFPPIDSICSITMNVTAGTVYYIAAENHSEPSRGGRYVLEIGM